MSWWQNVVTAYFILTPWSEIMTIAVVMVSIQTWQDRKERRDIAVVMVSIRKWQDRKKKQDDS